MTIERALIGTTDAAAAASVYVEDVFSTYLYSGTGGNITINNGIDLATNGGMVWTKCRSAAYSNYLFDTARGAGRALSSNTTSSQTASDAGSDLASFNINGFSIGPNYYTNGNSTSTTNVSWTFRKAPKFFTICTWTGNGVAGRQIPHDLACVPGMIIVKCTSTVTNWAVYHTSTGATKFLMLDAADAAYTGTTPWYNTAPTSANFTVGTSSMTNNSGDTYIAYLFADSNSGGFGLSGTDSVVACGSFTADGSRNAVVNLGWEPQYILWKRTNAADDWYVQDIMRGWSMTSYTYLSPNSSATDSTVTIPYSIPTSTGFTFQNSGLGAGGTYIYLAIRRPMKTPTDATKVFDLKLRTGNATAATITTSVSSVDAVMSLERTSYFQYSGIMDRLRGTASQLFMAQISAQNTNSTAITGFDVQAGYKLGTDVIGGFNADTATYVQYALRRAPGFFDVVCYTGTGSATTVAHNLGVAPELMIVKRRDALNNWVVYNAFSGNTQYTRLNTTIASTNGDGEWNTTTPTASVFSLGALPSVNASSGTYVAYLFATCPGVSKVGSYTGTGAAQNINCGFAAGARFVLIKRTDSTGAWYTYDSARGINASGFNDPYLLLNSTAAEVANTDYLGTYSSGFSLTSSAPADLNASGGSYIYLAIA